MQCEYGIFNGSSPSYSLNMSHALPFSSLPSYLCEETGCSAHPHGYYDMGNILSAAWFAWAWPAAQLIMFSWVAGKLHSLVFLLFWCSVFL